MAVLIGVVIATLVAVFAVITWSGKSKAESELSDVALKTSQGETVSKVVARQATTSELASSVTSTSASTAETPISHHIPQDSVLKRHYRAHVQYMIETVTTPRPTDSVLSRHYDHFVVSELAACLEDAAKLAGLVSQYDEARGAVSSAA